VERVKENYFAEQVVSVSAQRKKSVLTDETVIVEEQSASIMKYAPFFRMLEELMSCQSLENYNSAGELAS
jgi:hypothetical protein